MVDQRDTAPCSKAVHWMYRVTRGMDSTDRGTLVCWEDPGIPRRVQVRFLPDREGERPHDFWMSEPKEPVIGEDVEYSGVVFRAYGRMDVSAAEDMRFARATIKMPMRAQ